MIRLRNHLRRIDGRSYNTYKDIQGDYRGDGFSLFVDHVQGDPFAAPSKLRVRIDASEAGLPRDLFELPVRKIALEDFLARQVDRATRKHGGSRSGSGKSGLVTIDVGNQEVLSRTALVVRPEYVEARFQVGLPAAGRRVLGHQAEELLCRRLPEIARRGLMWRNIDPEEARRFVECVENQEAIRSQLRARGLVAFIAEGAILPRESGASDRPLAEHAIPFNSPESLMISFDIPNPIPELGGTPQAREPQAQKLLDHKLLAQARQIQARQAQEIQAQEIQAPAIQAQELQTPAIQAQELQTPAIQTPALKAQSAQSQGSVIRGMGIPQGVTLIVGGGYHGKSTLLKAVERGVYPHIPGDGREYVVTSRDAVKIRAEDGRRVEGVDISPFISNLPFGRDTRAFRSDDASGSTSQAANIIEAMEIGARVLLLDEDTSATNFMVRDARMQALVHKEHEPITPFLDRVRELWTEYGISTILVMGGCGDYFDVADTVILMRDYLPHEATEEAEKVAEEHRSERVAEVSSAFPMPRSRIPLASSFDPSRGKRSVKIDARALDLITFGTENIDLRGIEQLVDHSQTRAIGYALHLAVERFMDGERDLREVVEALERLFAQEGLDILDPFHRPERHPGDFARPRKFEIAAAINRLRTVRVRQSGQ